MAERAIPSLNLMDGVRGRLRYVMVLIAACVSLAILAPRPLLGPSEATHYAHLANSWLHGHLDLGAEPPGFPKAHNDWAKVTEFTDDTGALLRLRRCVTRECQPARDTPAATTLWWVNSEDAPRSFTRAQRRQFRTRWYVSFPPGPAVLMLPLVAVFGVDAPDTFLTLLIASLFATLLVKTLDEWRGRREQLHLLLAGAWLLASPATVVGSQGGVWFTAQMLASVCTILAIRAWLLHGVGWRAGTWLALACTCRPHLGVVAVLWLAWRDARDGSPPGSVKSRLAFLAPLAVVALLLALHNSLRFGDPLEFGHRWLDVRWQGRMQEFGLFSPRYLPRNLQCLIAVPFQLQAPWPWIKISIHGIGLALTAPWLLMSARRPPVGPRRRVWTVMALSGLVVAMIPLGYHNSGQLQVSYRFALDWIPFLMVAIVAGNPRAGWLLRALVVVGIAVNMHLSWAFKVDRSGLFVARPIGWPFQAEFTRPHAKRAARTTTSRLPNPMAR